MRLAIKKRLNKNKISHKEIDKNYQSIIDLACSINPNFESNMNDVMDGKICIETFIKDFEKHDIGTKLDQRMKEGDVLTMDVHKSLTENSQFLEQTVDILNQLINTDSSSNKEKDILAESISAMVDSSIDARIKSTADWKRFSDKKRAIQDGNIIDWAINNIEIKEEHTPKETHLEKDNQEKFTPFEDYLFGTDDEKKAICDKVADYLKPSSVYGMQIALMILALRANGQLRPIGRHTVFYTTLRNQFKPYIGSNQSINEYLNPNGRKQIPAENIESARKIFQL